MTTAQRDLLERLAQGELLYGVHPAMPTGSALHGSATCKTITDRTVRICIRAGWLRTQVSTEYFQPVVLTELGKQIIGSEQ